MANEIAVSNLTIQLTAAAQRATTEINSTNNALRKMKSAGSNAAKGLDDTKNKIKETSDEAKKSASAFGKLLSSMKRIAFYRLIRSALKAVASSIKEGINNLVLYSQALNNMDSSKANWTMSEFATTALYVKNTLGAALMPLLQSLVPVVNGIADAFIWATNAVNQFFHALKGETVFTKAKRYAVDYAEGLDKASGSAKELKKQIFGFDELNIFNAPSSGGRGGGAPEMDYSKMFEEADVSGILMRIRSAVEKEIKKIKQAIQSNLGMDFFVRLKANFTDILFNWSDLNKEDVAKKILTGFYGLLGGITGFTIGGPFGAIVGSILGVGLGVYISTIDFNGDGVLSQEEVLNMVRDVAAVLTGAVVGWTIGGPKGALIGASIGAGLTALIQSFVPEADMAFAGVAFAGLLLGVIKTIAEAEKMKFMMGAVGAGATTQFAILAATGLTLSIIALATNAGFKSTAEKIAVGIVEAILVIAGGVTGAALLGAVVGGPAGALIGITVAAGLTLLINSINWDYTPQSKREMEFLENKIDIKAKDNFLGSPASAKDPKVPLSVLMAEGRASGGWVDSSTFFYAGESGPELVGSVNGRTRVTNESQFTAGMEDIMDNTNTVILQAAQSLIQAIQSKDFTSVVQIGDRQIVSAYDRGKKLAGASLVE